MAQKKRISELHAAKPRREPPARKSPPKSTQAGRDRTELQTPRGIRPRPPTPRKHGVPSDTTYYDKKWQKPGIPVNLPRARVPYSPNLFGGSRY